MHHIFLVLFILTILICSAIPQSIDEEISLRVTPFWFGTFYTTSECNVDICCCIYGLLTLSKVKPNYLRIQGHLEGFNCPVNPQFDSTVTMPTGFKTEIILMGGPVDITLSDDSRIIRLNNQRAPSCNGGAIRNHARSNLPINSIFMIISILIVKNLI